MRLLHKTYESAGYYLIPEWEGDRYDTVRIPAGPLASAAYEVYTQIAGKSKVACNLPEPGRLVGDDKHAFLVKVFRIYVPLTGPDVPAQQHEATSVLDQCYFELRVDAEPVFEGPLGGSIGGPGKDLYLSPLSVLHKHLVSGRLTAHESSKVVPSDWLDVVLILHGFMCRVEPRGKRLRHS